MTRSRNEPTSELPAVLTIPRSQFEAELDERIKLGDRAFQRPIGDQQQLEAARSDFYVWDDYNRDLLRRRFTTSEIADAYAASAGVFFVGGHVSLPQDVQEFRDDLRSKLDRLNSVKERIPLFDEGSHAQEPRRGRAVTRDNRATNSVFIVHGHHEALKLAVHGFVRAVTDVEPVILHDQPNRGRTLLEKFEAVGGGAGYAIVLLTADDVGRAASADVTEEQPRARQNVVWEFGFFAGGLGRSRVAVIFEEGVELPSDLHGLVYIPFDEAGGWKLLLARELDAAGVNIDTAKLIKT